MKYLLIALILTGCGGVEPIDQPDQFLAQPDPALQTCITHAVRSESGSYTRHSRDGGLTWQPGACS